MEIASSDLIDNLKYIANGIFKSQNAQPRRTQIFNVGNGKETYPMKPILKYLEKGKGGITDIIDSKRKLQCEQNK